MKRFKIKKKKNILSEKELEELKVSQKNKDIAIKFAELEKKAQEDPNFDYATEMEKIIAENKISIGDMIDIDFYIPSENLAIQVSMQVLDDIDTKERETRAFAKLNAYIPDTKCILITNSEEATLDYDEIQIEVVPIWKWLLDR